MKANKTGSNQFFLTSPSQDYKKPKQPKAAFSGKGKTTIVSWNAHSLETLGSQSERLTTLLNTMDERYIDVLGLSESRWMGEGTTAIKGKMILHSGHTVRCVHGVAVIFSHGATRSWEEAGSVFHPVSLQILRTHVKLHMGYATIISAYAPMEPKMTATEAATEAEVFYTLLQVTVSNAPKKDRVFIIGDFKTCIGADTEQWGSVINHFGTREQNTNGIRLLDLYTTHGLLILNTWFQHKQILQLTWFPNGNRARPGHMYGYVIISRCLRTSLLDMQVFHGTQLDTDHELVFSTFASRLNVKGTGTPGSLGRRQPS